MKKTLICLLLLAHLFTGLAFALDTHPEVVAGHDSADVALHYDHSGDQQYDDHHCHGAAHLVALIFTQSTPFTARSHHDFFVQIKTPLHLYIAPLLRPPIA